MSKIKMEYSLGLASWYPDGSCHAESSISISAQEYEELFGRFVLKQENKTSDFLHAALKAHAARIRELEQQVRNLGGNPEDFDGEIEDAPKIIEREDPVKIAEQAREYFNTAVKVKESFMNVNVNLCEDGTLWIDDAKTDEQLAKFKVVEGE